MEQSPLPGQQSFLMTSNNGMLVSVPADKLEAWQQAQADESPETKERRKRTSEMIMRTLNELRSANASLPFSQEKSKIPVDIFSDRFQQEKQTYPFVLAYIGKRSPYDDTVIETEADYDRYLREHTYHILCEEATVRTVKQHDEILIKERDALRQKLDDASRLLLSTDDRVNAETSRLHDELDALAAKREKDDESHRRTRLRLLLAVAVLLVFSVLAGAGVISFGSRTPSRTYEQGYAEGQADQKAAAAGIYDEGYAAGQEDGSASGYRSGYAEGKDEGYNDGYYKGYWEGYADAGERSSGSGDSHGSGSGSHTGTGATRDTPVADTYIGNKSSKKFHLPTCSYLPDQNNQVTFESREEAIAAGYSPCGHCHP